MDKVQKVQISTDKSDLLRKHTEQTNKSNRIRYLGHYILPNPFVGFTLDKHQKSSHNSCESKFISQSLMAAALVKAYPSILRRCDDQTVMTKGDKSNVKADT